jgi:hypothetical protein
MNEQEQKQIPTIKELIEGATPGPWEYGNEAVWGDCKSEAIGEICEFVGPRNGHYIARCSPSVMREVVEALELVAGQTLPESIMFSSAAIKAQRALSLLSATANPESK